MTGIFECIFQLNDSNIGQITGENDWKSESFEIWCFKNPPVETRLGFLVKNEIFKPQILNDADS